MSEDHETEVNLIIILVVDALMKLYAKEIKEDIERGIIFNQSLLNLDTKDLKIEKFRKLFEDYITSNDGTMKKLEPFPKYSSKNKILTKKQDAELSLYFAVRHCIEIKNNNKEILYNLCKANVNYGYAIGLLDLDTPWIPKYHSHKNAHEIGGDVRRKKSEEKKQIAFEAFKNGGYTAYAECARDIHIELGIKDPNTVARWLSELDNKKKSI